MVATLSRLDVGHYEAARAAALSGVPERTVYHWKDTGLVVPSVSSTREMLWSYSDLLTLRLVRWLRIVKPETEHAPEIDRSTMAEVRQLLDRFGDSLWESDESGREVPTIRVTVDGQIVRVESGQRTVFGQGLLRDTVDLFAPFEAGVDLRQPDTKLRIVPGKVSGEPHLVGSRLTTRSVAGLARRGLSLDLIADLYPGEDIVALEQAVTLEDKLAAAA